MIITQIRTYGRRDTHSALFVNGRLFGTTLEDAGRPHGVKIMHETCIPEGVYKVTINKSRKFGKDMMMLYNQARDLSVDTGGIRFTGIRVHRGETVEHTSGCILLRGYEALQAEVQALLDDGEEVLWVIAGADFK